MFKSMTGGIKLNKKTKQFISVISFLLLVFVFVGTADAAVKKVRFSIFHSPDFFLTEAYQRVFEKVNKECKDEIEVTIYPASQLGGYEQVFQEVMRGTIEMCGNYPTSRFSKKFDMGSMPGITTSHEDVRRLLLKESPFTKFLKETYEKDTKVVYLGSFFEAYMTTAMAKGKEIAAPFEPGTNKKRVIRVVPVPVWREWFLGMGYQIATIPYAEVFSSMQTGIIDGNSGSGPEAAYKTLRDVMGSLIEFNTPFVTNDFVVSKRVWESFSPKVQNSIIKAFEAEQGKVFKLGLESHTKYIKAMKDAGIKIISPTPKDVDAMNKIAREKAWPVAYDAMGKEIFVEIENYLKNK